MNTRSADAIDGRQLRAVAFLEVRLEYVDQVLKKLAIKPAAGSAVVVGSGRGDLARGLARMGLAITAVDPSAAATEMAREESKRSELDIQHNTAEPERLPYDDEQFDLVYIADTLEVTDRLDEVLAQAARVLRPGGVLIYDTVNRTLRGRLIYLGAFQGIPMTRIMPPGRYAAERLRPPATVIAALAEHGLRNEDICGFKPKTLPELVKAVRGRRRGRITDEQAGELVHFVLERKASPQVTYFGYARK
ncbi:bifunctional 2-polyprenyl-6-hydroxyphenol methylase/3-demethylubiquinol 3-O-methyltransferase UbiG [Kutzneria sp. 744]|uniref:class I SAM-dependent methyltransferase n=1 Tax=Kutzneria sp. (strain 744) TaxID=345341 RepID=UPI0018DD56C6|nr:methyltransferase domain-containing protein [Kutzneria sp. 744]